MPQAKCADCGERFDEQTTGTYREVVGFERIRVQGGTNAVHLRRTTGLCLCRTCGDLRRAGHRHGQFGKYWEDDQLPGF